MSARHADRGERRTALYRFYDAHEALLYVGITNDPWRRWREHVLEQPWYPQVRHQAVTWYDTEEDARRAETRAIRTEGPCFNVAGALRPPEARVIFRIRTITNVCAAWATLWSVLVCVAVFAHPLTHWLAPVVQVMFISFLLPLVVMALVIGAPYVIRFGRWLDRVTAREDAR